MKEEEKEQEDEPDALSDLSAQLKEYQTRLEEDSEAVADKDQDIAMAALKAHEEEK